MSTRRRIGVSAATTEAARRQLMQPVTCWEKVWAHPETATANPTLQVYKWVKTDKAQQFSDDEGGADEPLAPLPDELEAVEGDEEMEQEEGGAPATQEASQPEAATQDDVSKPPSPKPQLSMSLQPSASELEGGRDGLDASLKPLNEDMDVSQAEKADGGGSLGLDMSNIGPDGLALEGSSDLSQMESADALMGGVVMDQSGDPFSGDMNEQ